MKKRYILLLMPVILLALGYYGYRSFTVHYDKLGEMSFYKDVDMELKVVLIHENLPFHYVGNSYSVACQSPNTKGPDINDEGEWKFDRIEPGWNKIPQAYLGDARENNKNSLLKSLAEEAKKLYLVTDSTTLVILASPDAYISFDGCRTFASWDLKDNVSNNLVIESTPEYEQCVSQHKKDETQGLTSYGDCSDVKLSGENLPVFENIVATNNGYASFKVTSSAFKNNHSLLVETTDFGKTWNFR